MHHLDVILATMFDIYFTPKDQGIHLLKFDPSYQEHSDGLIRTQAIPNTHFNCAFPFTTD